MYRFSTSSQANDLETHDAAEGSPHNYTNVEFTREKVSGTPRRLMKGTVGEENHWYGSSLNLLLPLLLSQFYNIPRCGY